MTSVLARSASWSATTPDQVERDALIQVNLVEHLAGPSGGSASMHDAK